MVQQYFNLGIHRTGTEVDTETAQWMSSALTERGMATDVQPVAFEQWSGTSQLLADGNEVAHLPVFYEYDGAVRTDNVYLAAINPMSGGFPGALDDPIAAARRTGAEAAVLATEHPEGSLVAVNRTVGGGSGFPTVLVAGRDIERLRAAHQVTLSLEGSRRAGQTHNVVARNEVTGPPLLLTTPLNGWFGCAGERGTGIAVLLSLVEQLGDLPLLVVATGGHELTWFGATQWVRDNTIAVAAIVHVGASIAVEGREDGELIATRLAMTSVPEARARQLSRALVPAGLDLATDVENFIGEGEAFCQIDAPLLSFTGAGLDFHTPEDTPARVTSPAGLATVAAAVGAAARAIHDLGALDHGHGG